MKLEDADFPLIVEGNRIYTQRRRNGQVLVAIDEGIAEDVARRLNMSWDLVEIPRLTLGRPEEDQP